MENEQELESQDYQQEDNGSVPDEYQDERAGSEDGGQEGSIEEESFDSKAEIGKMKEEFTQNFREMQSKKDIQIAELQGQVKQTIEMLKNQGNQQQEKPMDLLDLKDDDGYARDLNAEDIQKFVQDAIKQDRKQQNEQYEQQSQQQTQKQIAQQKFMESKSDSEEIFDFYNSDKNGMEKRMMAEGIDSSNIKEAYLFVKGELREKKYKERSKPNVPPVGNNGSNFSNRGGSPAKSAMAQAQERSRAGVRRNLDW